MSKITKQIYPLGQLTLAEAKDIQFRMTDLLHRHLGGEQLFDAGDWGAPPELGRSRMTAVVERMLAELFDAEDAVLVRGAGTGAIRCTLMSNLLPGSRVIVHQAPFYPTTKVTFRAMGIQTVPVDFNTCEGLEEALAQRADCVYIQHSRQLIGDSYDLESLVRRIRAQAPSIFIPVDDNYAVFQLPRIGSQLGADLSMFSTFKVLGEVGVGCVIGKKRFIDPIREDNYSGGSKVNGPEAIASYKWMIFAPVAQAIEAEVVEEVARRLNNGEVIGVVAALVANHQERVVLVEMDTSLDTQKVLRAARKHGAAPYPVGSASRHEAGALFYRLSGVMRQAEPELARRIIRINPLRAGPDTVIRILKDAIRDVQAGEEQRLFIGVEAPAGHGERQPDIE